MTRAAAASENKIKDHKKGIKIELKRNPKKLVFNNKDFGEKSEEATTKISN